MDNNILVVGIAGGTGSGKTTLMDNLIGKFQDMVTILSHDNYYRRHDELTYEQRCQLNYDEPASLETELMARHLDKLRHGEAIDCPVYDFTIHNRSDETIRLEPKPVIIVDVNERGRTLESVLHQYQQTVKPMHEKYVEPSKKYAHIVVPEGGKNLVALDMITGRIQRHLEEVCNTKA